MITAPTVKPATVAPTGCCPPFDPATWDGREVTWTDKPFVKEHVHSLLHIPLDMGRKMVAVQAKIEAASAKPEHPLMLADESRWGSDLYIDVTGPVPKTTMTTLSGTFLAKVFEGPYRNEPKWVREMKRYVADHGRTLRKLYFGYTTCPACAKAYGHNYVVLMAEVDPVVH